MKTGYDNNTRNVLIENFNRLFASGSLIASNFGDLVGIKYLDTDRFEIYDIYDIYTNIQKLDGSTAGANVGAVVDYLNAEFAKGRITGSGEFSGLTSTRTISDARIKAGDKIIVSPQSATLNEIIFVSAVSDGNFIVTRVIINALGVLTSALNFNWFRI
jgi:hypothetical protein